ncbi:MAG: hypothetical protein IPI60_17910 [Saprospiraceae bacterium]|nr:hypothetical protein [Saprospiraceae bacterium]
MKLTVSWKEVFVFLILVSSLDLKAQYYPQGPTPHVVLIETNGAKGQGILFASDEASVKQVYLITSRSIFTKNLEYSAGIPNTDFVDEPVIVSYYFSEIEKNFLKGKEEYCGDISPLNIKFNFKSILDSTDCVTFFDSSDVIMIKLYDQDIVNIQRYISFSSVCSLIPLIHWRNEIGKSGSISTQV